LTHGLLGASIAQAAVGRRFGPRALAWGAFAAMLPDVDVFFIPFAGPFGEWTYHRGITHSMLVAPFVAWGLALLATRKPRPGESRGAWFALLLAALWSHPLLDFCTTYGTQLLTPLTHHRFAIDAIAIVDPFYSLMFVAALLVAWASGVGSRAARGSAIGALALSTVYLVYGQALNVRAEELARQQLQAEGVSPLEVKAYPTLLQLYYRRVVVREAGAVRVGWISLWRPQPIAWERFTQRQDPRIDAARQTAEGRLFEWFALGQTAASVTETATGSVVELDDLRYGFPGRADKGAWALSMRFDAQGRRVGPAERVNHRLPRPVRALLSQIFSSAFPAAPAP
jgi:inner membrane protein